MNEPACKEAVSKISSELSQADTELAQLTVSIDRLAERLQPVSIPNECDEKATSECQPDRVRCEIDSTIHAIGNRVQRQCARIITITEELQI